MVNVAAKIRISTPTAAYEGGRTQIKFESAAAGKMQIYIKRCMN
jgi:hypothetical protein